MYIGTDLVSKTGLSEKLDKLDFTFSIHPYSIPFLKKYGIKIDADQFTLHDKAQTSIRRAIKNLDDDELQCGNIEIRGRNIKTEVNYNKTQITATTTANIS
jgi:hypothetical protein